MSSKNHEDRDASESENCHSLNVVSADSVVDASNEIDNRGDARLELRSCGQIAERAQVQIDVFPVRCGQSPWVKASGGRCRQDGLARQLRGNSSNIPDDADDVRRSLGTDRRELSYAQFVLVLASDQFIDRVAPDDSVVINRLVAVPTRQ
jgi:hypothetical protein